ncbi:MAG: hypothetical protein WD184_00940 [Acidimicrobiia bacterium]
MPVARRPCPDLLEVTTPEGWSSGPVALLNTHRARRLGLRPGPGPIGALLRTRSIHTFGMHAPIGVVALSGEGIVTRAAVVPPHRVFFAKGARWMLEVAPHPLPKAGTRLLILALDSCS